MKTYKLTEEQIKEVMYDARRNHNLTVKEALSKLELHHDMKEHYGKSGGKYVDSGKVYERYTVGPYPYSYTITYEEDGNAKIVFHYA